MEEFAWFKLNSGYSGQTQDNWLFNREPENLNKEVIKKLTESSFDTEEERLISCYKPDFIA